MDHAPPARFLHAGFIVTVTAILALLVVAGATVGAGPAEASARRHSTVKPPRRTSTSTTTTPPGPASPTPTTGPGPTSTAAPATTVAAPPTTTAAPAAPVAPATTGPPPASTKPAPSPSATRANSVLFGVVTDDMAQLNTFETDAGKRVTLYGTYASFAFDADFNAAAASSIRARGTQPMITWEPWDPTTGSANQPAYSLGRIIAGVYDGYINRWATEVKTWGQPLWVRFAHEMNGDWYPWAEGVNGNTPGQSAAAWRHVHDIFQRAGVTNVTWVWSPNVITGTAPSLASLYPGDSYVDWLGVDGYNWGSTQSWSTWQSFDSVFGPTLASLQQLSGRPIVIGEAASTELGGDKAAWTRQFFASLAAQPRIKAFVWFNLNKETDWRIESSAAARAAFAAGVANPRY